MARPYWKGAISFGLVNVPVSLYPATRKLDFSFHLYHDEDGGRIREKRVCERDGKEVPWQHIVKGYELSKTQVVTLTQEELRAADPERDRTIGIEEFVKLEEIDPLQLDQSVLRRAGGPFGEGLRAPGGGAREGGAGGDRPHRAQHQAAPVHASERQWPAGAHDPRLGGGGARGPRGPADRGRRQGAPDGRAAGPLDERQVPPSRFKDEHRGRVEALIRKKAKGSPSRCRRRRIRAGWWTWPARSRRASPPRGRLRPVRRPGLVPPAHVAGPRPPGPAPAVARSPGSAQRKSEHEA